MPIEIRELHIKMNVTPSAGASGGAAAGATAAEGEAQRASEEELVTRCVEQVMELLRNRRER